MAWFMQWLGGHGMVYSILLGGPGMVYGMSLRAWHGIAWRCMGLHMVWLGRMTCIWYGLAGMAWFMVWSIGYVMTYDVVWRAWHGNWNGLVGIA